MPLFFLYLLGNYGEPEETLDLGVRRLPAAHSLVIEGGSVRKTRYWDAGAGRDLDGRTEAECVEEYLHLFQLAVQRGCGRGSVGASLSGGLDSSSVVALAAELSHAGIAGSEGIETFSLLFRGMPCDERPYVEAVVGHNGVRSHFFEHDGEQSWLDLDRYAQMTDVPFGLTVTMLGPLLQAARGRGVHVMLGGMGGDDYLNDGLAHLPRLLCQGRLPSLVRQVRQRARASGSSSLDVFSRYCLRPAMPRFIKSMVRTVFPPARRLAFPTWINKHEFDRLGISDRLQSPALPGGRTIARRRA